MLIKKNFRELIWPILRTLSLYYIKITRTYFLPWIYIIIAVISSFNKFFNVMSISYQHNGAEMLKKYYDIVHHVYINNRSSSSSFPSKTDMQCIIIYFLFLAEQNIFKHIFWGDRRDRLPLS